MNISPTVGLCTTCKYIKVIKSAKGSYFIMCGLAKTDPHFSKYPVLPVIQCLGYKRVETEDEKGTG